MAESKTEKLLEELSSEILRHIHHAGTLRLQAIGLRMLRREESNRSIDCVAPASVGIICAGSKEARILSRRFAYGAGACVVMSVDLPDSFEAVAATHENPFLALSIDLEESVMTTVLARLREQAENGLSAAAAPASAAAVFPASEAILSAFLRFLRLADSGDDVPFVAPLVKEELYYRLLTSPGAEAFRALFRSGTPESRIRESAAWMRANYRTDFDVDAVASRVGMSPATFYRHFRNVMGSSPRQYVKTLRLYEGRRLMLEEHFDANAAAFEVGYESPAYFSREFKRAFGLPPKAYLVSLCGGEAA